MRHHVFTERPFGPLCNRLQDAYPPSPARVPLTRHLDMREVRAWSAAQACMECCTPSRMRCTWHTWASANTTMTLCISSVCP
eukprot:15264867-Alexandrium_andersonii.AAC.1